MSPCEPFRRLFSTCNSLPFRDFTRAALNTLSRYLESISNSRNNAIEARKEQKHEVCQQLTGGVRAHCFCNQANIRATSNQTRSRCDQRQLQLPEMRQNAARRCRLRRVVDAFCPRLTCIFPLHLSFPSLYNNLPFELTRVSWHDYCFWALRALLRALFFLNKRRSS